MLSKKDKKLLTDPDKAQPAYTPGGNKKMGKSKSAVRVKPYGYGQNQAAQDLYNKSNPIAQEQIKNNKRARIK